MLKISSFTKDKIENIKIILLILILCFSEIINAKMATRMRKAKTSVVVPAVVLSWNPSVPIDDFMSTFVQSFTLTNSGTAAANGLVFSAPVINPNTHSTSGEFVISSLTTTCGASLAMGASCTVDIQYMTCNQTCTAVIPVITNGTVTATSGTVSATITNMTFNGGVI